MTEFSGNTWLLLAGAAAACVLALLHCMAARIRAQTKVHDLRMGVARLRLDFAERLKKIEESGAGEVIEAIPIEEFEAAQKQRQQDERLVSEQKIAA